MSVVLYLRRLSDSAGRGQFGDLLLRRADCGPNVGDAGVRLIPSIRYGPEDWRSLTVLATHKKIR